MGKHRKWSPQDNQDLIDLINKNVLWQEIARYFKCNVWQVQKHAKDIGYSYKKPFTYKLVSTTVSLPEQLDSLVLREARNAGVTKAYYIRTAMEDHINALYPERGYSLKSNEPGKS